VTAYEYLCRINGKKATDLVWKPLLVGKFDVFWDKITMAWLWTRIHQRQTSKIKGELTERLGYFDGGFQIVVQRWLEELAKRDVRVHTGTQITRFDERDGKPVITVGGEEKQYDSVLAALPSNVFAKLTAGHPAATEAYQKQLSGIDHLGAVLMVLRTSEPITDTYWHQIHDADAPFLVFLSLDSLIGVERTGGRYIYYVGDYTQNDSELMHASEDEIRQRWLAGIQRFFPEFDPADVMESHIFKFRNAQHIVDVTYESRIPDLKTPLPGYYLSNFSQIFPEDRGTNLAVRDGLKVARMIMEDLPLAPERGAAPVSATA
jgi:protoporphyrinogen oxidase